MLAPDTQGKVRDIYDVGDRLLLVATDRISAFDFVLADPIPYKGEVLTKLSLFWFDLVADIVPNHLISTDVADFPEEFAPYASYLRGRTMLVNKAEVFPIECIVRGYLTGSGIKEYNAKGTVCGIELPAGLTEASKLEPPLFTPSTKAAQGEHDENISFEQTVDIIGKKDAEDLKRISLDLYSTARDYAAGRGIIIADTKFEFGTVNGVTTLIDEVLTCDSSRFWPADSYEPGVLQPSFDKQIVRNWLENESGWDKTGEPPRLPREIIELTSAKYIEAYEKITGEKFVGESDVA
ncbi:MAG: phosphoribosylaminoimidazolesuccinocarboxamide synthase [Coriobacteriia bacterium]|nr:phosphoribosylaminoimidazolesuccinocarboxamide synthase [Coriobacteriia bacterium]